MDWDEFDQALKQDNQDNQALRQDNNQALRQDDNQAPMQDDVVMESKQEPVE